jgi:cell division protein FtsW (lipid II flippase)
MTDRSHLEAKLLGLGFAFQVFCALALLLAPSVQDGRWNFPAASLAAFVPLAVWAIAAVIVHGQLNRTLPGRDPFLFPTAMFLCGWSLQILVRLSPNTAFRQTLWLVVALSALILILHLPHDLEWLRKYRYLWLGAALAALGATLLAGVGAEPGSARLWLGVDGIYFQPSEFLRWVLPVFAAFTLAPGRDVPAAHVPRARESFPVLLFGAVGVGLHLLQQDLGAAVLLVAAIVVMLYLAYRKPIIPVLGILAVGCMLAAGYSLDATVKLRLATWWNPWLDPSNTSYQVVQSLISVASGGLIGRGPGLGAPALVPVAYSDFLFTALSEEYGVVGAVGCLIAIAVLVLRGFHAALRSANGAGRLMAGCLSALLGIQSVLIIGGVLRLLPLTGITLPFMSYGGSSLLASTIALTLILILSAGPPDCSRDVRPDRPIRTLGALVILALAGAGISLGWWGVYRASALRERTDNYRRVLHDRQARRGNLYDRNGAALAITAGAPGSYTRQYPDPAAAPVVGYTTAYYGQGGMEAVLDSWLRGEAARNALDIWWSETVLGVPAEGVDAYLTVDRALTDFGSVQMNGRAGAIVVMRAGSGDILALLSTPTFDPATLEKNWDQILSQPLSPLLNRATQGLYPPGTMLYPFFAAEAIDRGWWTEGSGLCGAPFADWILSHPDYPDQVLSAFHFNADPVMDLPTVYVFSPSFPASAGGVLQEFNGYGKILVSPIQLAVALASIADGGMAPAPRLVSRLDSPTGWISLPPPGRAAAMIPADTASRLRKMLPQFSGLGSATAVEWSGCGGADANPDVSWYAGLQTGSEDPLVVVAVMEGQPSDAPVIGRKVLARALASG